MMRVVLVLVLAGAVCDAVIKYPPMMTKQPPPNDEILFHVASRQDENDKPFLIECEAEGEPAPR